MHDQSKKSNATLAAPIRFGLFQRKFRLNASDDAYEQEADRVADGVMRAPAPWRQRACSCGGGCSSCKQREKVQTQRIGAGHAGEMEAPPIVHEVLQSSGQPLASAARTTMESHFGHDFSGVRVHADRRAAESANAVGARAYTVGRDIVFGSDEYLSSTASGQRLLAHELTHVLQQSSSVQPKVQRDEFQGGPGKTAKDKDRPLKEFTGPMPEQKSPGGTVVPNTSGTGQNCAGDSCSIQKWINWPFLGFEAPGIPTIPDWKKAVAFVPSGFTRVNCMGVDVFHTRCKQNELDLIAFLYKWPVTATYKGKPIAATQSDFHMIGRSAGSLPSGWHSKMDSREKVADIRSPEQSLADAYPHTNQPDRTIEKLCFCCDQKAITTL